LLNLLHVLPVKQGFVGVATFTDVIRFMVLHFNATVPCMIVIIILVVFVRKISIS
jgi:hypothetical protein